MPALATVSQTPQVSNDTVFLPPEMPTLPDDVISRFPNLGQWQQDLDDWWKQARNAIQESVGDTNTITNTINKDAQNLVVTYNGLTAALTLETSARVTADMALATSIATVAAGRSKISVQSTAPATPQVNDLWVDTSDSNKAKYWDGSAWQYKQDQVLAAAVSAETSARVTADGFLSAKYTLTVVAGNVVTGMNITSSSGSGTNISSVTFQTDRFLIYSGSTGVQMFDASAGSVRIGATLVVDTTNQKMYIGTGTYGNTNTFFYIDSAGQFSLKDKLKWNGTTLTIAGSINLVNAASVSSAGLYIGSDYMGYYSGSAWTSYLKSDGTFAFQGTGNNYVTWDGTHLNVRGQLNASDITAGTVSASYIAAGTIGAYTILLNGSGSILASSNYVGGTSGWVVVGDGTAEFNNVIVRGGIYATYGLFQGTVDIGTGTANTHIDSSSITFGDTGSTYHRTQYSAAGGGTYVNSVWISGGNKVFVEPTRFGFDYGSGTVYWALNGSNRMETDAIDLGVALYVGGDELTSDFYGLKVPGDFGVTGTTRLTTVGAGITQVTYLTVTNDFTFNGSSTADLKVGGNNITGCSQLTTTSDINVGGSLRDAGGNPHGPALNAGNIIRIYFSGSNVYADIDNGAATVLLG